MDVKSRAEGEPGRKSSPHHHAKKKSLRTIEQGIHQRKIYPLQENSQKREGKREEAVRLETGCSSVKSWDYCSWKKLGSRENQKTKNPTKTPPLKPPNKSPPNEATHVGTVREKKPPVGGVYVLPLRPIRKKRNATLERRGSEKKFPC